VHPFALPVSDSLCVLVDCNCHRKKTCRRRLRNHYVTFVQLVAVKIKKPHTKDDVVYPFGRQWVLKCRADYHALYTCRAARQGQPDLNSVLNADVMHVFGAIVSPQDLHREFVDNSQHLSDEVCPHSHCDHGV
jgi:hypothetical protein